MIVINLVDLIALGLGLIMILCGGILIAIAKIIDAIDRKKKKKQMKGE